MVCTNAVASRLLFRIFSFSGCLLRATCTVVDGSHRNQGRAGAARAIIACVFAFLLIPFGMGEAIAQAVKVETSPVKDPGWLVCVTQFKDVVRAKGRFAPNWFRYAGGVCAEELPLESGQLFMMIKRPGIPFDTRNEFEQSLESARAPGSDVICSDRLKHYAGWLQEKIRQDPRCIGFPGVRSVKPGTSGRPPSEYVFDKAPMRVKGAPIKGTAHCSTSYVAGKEKKIITWHSPEGVYAINGHARSVAERRGWKDGTDTFSPSQMQQLLDRGLGACP